MSSELDPSDFVDADLHAARHTGTGSGTTPSSGGSPQRPPTRAEMDVHVTDVQQELSKLKQAQEELERRRAALEETRRRRIEWETSRQELVHSLTRGLGLLEEAEFAARRDAEQMAKAIIGLQDALTKVQKVQEESWTAENFEIELTRALTTVENARQEWNSARMKFPLLTGVAVDPVNAPAKNGDNVFSLSETDDLLAWCKRGLAFTLPLVIALGAILVVLIVRK